MDINWRIIDTCDSVTPPFIFKYHRINFIQFLLYNISVLNCDGTYNCVSAKNNFRLSIILDQVYQRDKNFVENVEFSTLSRIRIQVYVPFFCIDSLKYLF